MYLCLLVILLSAIGTKGLLQYLALDESASFPLIFKIHWNLAIDFKLNVNHARFSVETCRATDRHHLVGTIKLPARYLTRIYSALFS